MGICRAVWAVASGADAVYVLAPRTCEGGGTSPQTGTGGSSSSAYLSQIRAKNRAVNTERSIICRFRKFALPPPPVCATFAPPRKRGGQGVYPPVYLNCPPNSNLPHCCVNPQNKRSPVLRQRGTGDFVVYRWGEFRYTLVSPCKVLAEVSSVTARRIPLSRQAISRGSRNKLPLFTI